MDRISVSHLVQDRTDELRRTADQVRQERSLRAKLAAAAAAVPSAQPVRPAEAVPLVEPVGVQAAGVQPDEARPAEGRPSPATAAGCTSAEHAA